MNYYKSWLFNGIPVFISTAILAIKAILDSWLLGGISDHYLQAFALVFPIIIFTNAISLSLANSISGTGAKWIDKDEVNGQIFFLWLIVSFLIGLITSLFLYLMKDFFIAFFNAEEYYDEISGFIMMLCVFLPFQFVSIPLIQISRFIRLFKSFSLVQIFCGILGAFISFWLLSVKTLFEPLSSIVISNSIMSILSFFLCILIIYPRFSDKVDKVKSIDKEFLWRGISIFSSTFMVQLIAVLFIFYLTYIISYQSKDMIGIFAYITRVEQLILMLAFAFINVILPEVVKDFKTVSRKVLVDLIDKAVWFLLTFNGVLVFLILIISEFSFSLIGDSNLENLFLISTIWFMGCVIQGTVIFYSQVLNVILAPKIAVKLNVVRFLLIGFPFIYLGSHLGNELGLTVGLAITHTLSWFIYRFKVKKLLLYDIR